MKIVFRDDDLCAYSNLNEFKAIYDLLDIPVTLGIIPFGVGEHRGHKIYGVHDNYLPKALKENAELCEYLKEKVKEGVFEVALHGYDHSFVNHKGHNVSSMLLKSKKQLVKEINEGKDYLEKTLLTRVTSFIPPTNKMTKNMIKAININHLNCFGLIYLFERPFSLRNNKNIYKRWISRVKYGAPICGVLDYGKRKELWSFKFINYDESLKLYNIAKQINVDISFATHYWEVRDNKLLFEDIKKFVDYVKKDNGCFSTMTEVCGHTNQQI